MSIEPVDVKRIADAKSAIYMLPDFPSPTNALVTDPVTRTENSSLAVVVIGLTAEKCHEFKARFSKAKLQVEPAPETSN